MGFSRSSVMKKAKASSSSSASSMFFSELIVPSVATGAVIGKKGSTIKSFQNTPGISSVKLSVGRLEIRGESEKAVQGVVSAIERLLCDVVSRSKGYHPDFFITCLCKSLADPLLPMHKICFEKFVGEICSDRTYDMDCLSAQFSSKMGISESVLSSHWDFSAYKTTVISCLQSLRSTTEHKTIKLVIRFGKQLYDIGPNLSQSVESGDFISVSGLQKLNVQRELKSLFSTACSDTFIRDVRLHLVRLQYEKVSTAKKISLHVADLVEEHVLRYNVSVRCGPGKEVPVSISTKPKLSTTAAVVTRVRRLPMRHGFVTFCREGRTTTDFRMGIATHAMGHLNETDIPPGLVEWVEQAWRDRTPDHLLVFAPPGRFLIINIRYKNTETYVTEKCKLRISRVAGGDRTNMMGNEKWECRLSSRWFKSNYGSVQGAHRDNSTWEDVESTVETDVLALVTEAIKFSEVVCPSA